MNKRNSFLCFVLALKKIERNKRKVNISCYNDITFENIIYSVLSGNKAA